MGRMKYSSGYMGGLSDAQAYVAFTHHVNVKGTIEERQAMIRQDAPLLFGIEEDSGYADRPIAITVHLSSGIDRVYYFTTPADADAMLANWGIAFFRDFTVDETSPIAPINPVPPGGGRTV